MLIIWKWKDSSWMEVVEGGGAVDRRNAYLSPPLHQKRNKIKIKKEVKN